MCSVSVLRLTFVLRQSVLQVYGTGIGLRWLSNVGAIYFMRKLIGDIIFENFSAHTHVVLCIKLSCFSKSPVK